MSLIIALVSCKVKNTNAFLKENTTAQDSSYYTIVSYGFPNSERLALMEMISEKWKIKYIEAAGCEVTEELIDNADVENKKTYAVIEKKYGKDWREKYEKDLEDAAMKQADIMDILITNKTFRVQLKKCNIEIDGIYKDVKQLKGSAIYETTIYGYDEENKRINCCTVWVDTKERTIKI
ncbi:hypothetical protein [Chryseobacterium sp.]|uniref:FEKKY domain-containing protein n=1 Tax=Chryseobacterium sp. TaxID=1871047 RepID=UPI0024E242FF|nr:hypothetical protein [Chryseobacterium sp.]